MTYSSTNEDKLQIPKIIYITKNIIPSAAGLLFLGFMAANIVKQVGILSLAKVKNMEMKNKVNVLESTNRKLKQQIEYATSSAYLEQQARDKFGLGNKNDAWLILPEEKDYSLWGPTETENPDPPLKQWISLFTR